MPSADGSDRLRARELRRHRPVAHAGRGHTGRREGPARSTTRRSMGRSALRNWLATSYGDQFVTVATEKLLTYALGRGVEYRDMPLVRAIARDVTPEQRPLLGDGAGRRQEPAVPDEYEASVPRRPRQRHATTSTPRPGESTEPCRSSPRGTSAGARSCKGAGVTLALPLLDAMVPAGTALAQTVAGQPKTRFVGVFFPHGMAPGHWEPAAEGALPEKLPYILESLEKVKDQTVVLSGLWSQSAEPPEGTTGSDHWVAAAYLTGIKPRKTAGSDATVGSATIDQMIAQKIGQETLLPSLQLAVEDPELELEQLRRRLQLLVHELDFVDRAADADGARTCRGPARCRWSSTRRSSSSACSAAARRRKFAPQRMKQSQSILDSLVERAREPAPAAGRGGRPHGQSVHRRDSRDRAPHSAGGQGLERRAGARSAARHPGAVRRAHPAALGHAGAGLQGRHHARGDAARRARPDGPRLPFPKSALFPEGGTSVSFHGGSHHQDDPVQIRRYAHAEPLSRVDDGVSGREAEGRSPTATARCSTAR